MNTLRANILLGSLDHGIYKVCSKKIVIGSEECFKCEFCYSTYTTKSPWYKDDKLMQVNVCCLNPDEPVNKRDIPQLKAIVQNQLDFWRTKYKSETDTYQQGVVACIIVHLEEYDERL